MNDTTIDTKALIETLWARNADTRRGDFSSVTHTLKDSVAFEKALRTLTAENERLTTNLRHWKEECGKVHSKIAALTTKLEQTQFWYEQASAEREAFAGKLELAEAELAQHQWHRVDFENDAPPVHTHIWCLNRDGKQFEGCICYGMHRPFFTYPRGDGNASNTCPDWIDVVGWMPLPSPPKTSE